MIYAWQNEERDFWAFDVKRKNEIDNGKVVTNQKKDDIDESHECGERCIYRYMTAMLAMDSHDDG